MKKRWWLAALAVLAISLAAVPALAQIPNGAGVEPPNQPIAAPGNGDGDTGDASKPVSPSRPPAYDTEKAVAPIDGVDIMVRESMPPQYAVKVTFGLPNGCIEPGGYEVERRGNDFHIQVWILEPTDPDLMCTMVYGMASYHIELGSDLVAGATYRVIVNGEATEFVAQ